MINLYLNGLKTDFKQWLFPAGEVGVLLPIVSNKYEEVELQVLFPTSDEIMMMFNIFDALKQQGIPRQNVILHMPYFPYARQDRVCKEGESFALSVFCKMLDALGYFGTLWVSDLHSPVVKRLLEQEYYTVHESLQSTTAVALPTFNWLFAPDKGAKDKVDTHLQVKNRGTGVAYFQKQRIGSGIVYPHIPVNTYAGTACVVDDICDGGETFLQLGRMLKQTQSGLKLSLYVTHGIFSNPDKFKELLEIYDTIYVSYLMNQSVKHLVKEI